MSTIGSFVFFECPVCKCHHSITSYSSYNTIGARTWSDSFQSCVYLPGYSSLVYCPKCMRYYFTVQLIKTGELKYSEYLKLFSEVVPPKREKVPVEVLDEVPISPSFINELDRIMQNQLREVYSYDEFRAAIVQFNKVGYPSIDEEYGLLNQYIQSYNTAYGRSNNKKASKREKTEFRANNRRLIQILYSFCDQIKPNEIITEEDCRNQKSKILVRIAECYREIGEFDKAVEILTNISLEPSRFWDYYVSTMIDYCNRSSVKVFEILDK